MNQTVGVVYFQSNMTLGIFFDSCALYFKSGLKNVIDYLVFAVIGLFLVR